MCLTVEQARDMLADVNAETYFSVNYFGTTFEGKYLSQVGRSVVDGSGRNFRVGLRDGEPFIEEITETGEPYKFQQDERVNERVTA